jgi:hypothetical protein
MPRAIPRMATAVAHTAGTVEQLGREPFLTVVLGTPSVTDSWD